MFRALALLAAGLLFLTSCLVGNPAPGDLAGLPTPTPTLKDIAYGSERGCEDERSDVLCAGSQLLDIYPATSGASRGTIVWIHGGGLFHGDKSEPHSAGPVFEQLRRGWSVVAVNYRLLRPWDWQPPTTTTMPAPTSTTSTTTASTSTASATTTSTTAAPSTSAAPSTTAAPTTTVPGGPPPGSQPPPKGGYDNAYPAALTDVVAAIEWVRTNGRSHGLDTSHLVVGGHSAGGMLAAMVGLGWNSPVGAQFGIKRPDAFVTMAAPMDLAAWDTAELMAAWLGDDAKRMIRPLSPIHNIDPADPPGYLAHGDRDNVVSAYHATATEFVYGLKGIAADVRVDIVDRDSRGTSMGPGPRWHLPGEGVGMDAFNRFMDDI